jgi:hypothetical protein
VQDDQMEQNADQAQPRQQQQQQQQQKSQENQICKIQNKKLKKGQQTCIRGRTVLLQEVWYESNA